MHNYSFEKIEGYNFSLRQQARNDRSFQDELRIQDTFVLLKKFGIIDTIPESKTDETLNTTLSQLDPKHANLLKNFVRNNIRNIRWYELKIIRENSFRLLYAWITAIFVFGVPITIGFATVNADELHYDGAELIGTSLTVLLASVIGVHKLITSWMEKRRYRSHFFQAKTDLQNLLFALEEKMDLLRADANLLEPTSEEENKTTGSKINFMLTEEMEDELLAQLKESREIVQRETKAFFEMSAVSTFDLGSILSTSGETAKGIFKTFRSHSFDLDKKKQEEEKARQNAEASRINKVKADIEIQSNALKLKRLTEKETLLIDKYYTLKGTMGYTDKNELALMKKEIDTLQQQIEDLEIEEIRLQSLSNAGIPIS
ncbi:MAG: hypothetical protein ACFHU9_09040 [Fluviicola sp.]